ncbi:MAG: PAS domain-containing protein [Methanospirillum sp.]|nr:PAS domain-containing protein [Methanospirillum sp.]
MEKDSAITAMMFRCRADAQLSFESVDEGSRTVCGYTRSELVDTGLLTLLDLVQPEERELVRNRIQAGISGKKSFVVHTRLKTKDQKETAGIMVGSGSFTNPLSLTSIEGYIISLDPIGVNQSG